MAIYNSSSCQVSIERDSLVPSRADSLIIFLFLRPEPSFVRFLSVFARLWRLLSALSSLDRADLKLNRNPDSITDLLCQGDARAYAWASDFGEKHKESTKPTKIHSKHTKTRKTNIFWKLLKITGLSTIECTDKDRDSNHFGWVSVTRGRAQKTWLSVSSGTPPATRTCPKRSVSNPWARTTPSAPKCYPLAGIRCIP